MRRRLKEKLSASISSKELKYLYNSFDILGDIAILKIANDDVTAAEAAAKTNNGCPQKCKNCFSADQSNPGGFQG